MKNELVLDLLTEAALTAKYSELKVQVNVMYGMYNLVMP